jgi:hypothetical protein
MARLKLLRALGAQPHRYRRLRRGTVLMSVALLFAVPLARLARFDAWGGQHWALRRRVDGV